MLFKKPAPSFPGAGFSFLYVFPLLLVFLCFTTSLPSKIPFFTLSPLQIPLFKAFQEISLHALSFPFFYATFNNEQKGARYHMENQFETFFRANERRIHFQIHRLRIPHNLYDEFHTEGIVALWRAYQDVDQAKGNVGTFLNYRVRYRLIDLIRKKQREANQAETFLLHSITEMTDGCRHRDSNTPLINLPTIPVTDDSLWQAIKQQ